MCSLHFRREDSQNYLNGRIPEGWFCFKLALSILLPRKGKHSREWVNLPLQLIKPWSSHEHCCAWNVYNEAECLNSLHNPVLKSLSSAMKVAIFRKPLLVYLETLRQVGKIDCAKGQMLKCSNTCMLDPFQNLFPFSYFLSLQLFLCQVFSVHFDQRTVLNTCCFLLVLTCTWFHGFMARVVGLTGCCLCCISFSLVINCIFKCS